MPIVDASFVFDFESRLRVQQTNEYARMLATLYFQRFTKMMTSESKQEVIGWLQDSAFIESQGLGGNVKFDDMSMIEQTIVNSDAGKGLRVRKQQFEDLDGNGVAVGTKWVQNISAFGAYWPQQQIMSMVKANTATCYDGKNLFVDTETVSSAATGAHPFNPNNTALGAFANWFTGSASGTQGYPGACPIDVTNASTIETARNNLNKVYAYIAGAIKMPNGITPRFLKPTLLVHPPALTARVAETTDAKFIAAAAGSGGGSQDIEGLIRKYGFGEPIEAPELSAANGGSDSTYYVVCEQIAKADQLGAVIYQNREPFAIQFYSGMGSATGLDAILYRAQELQWLTHGRNAVAPGHPFMIYRVDAT
jgi:hypothetical protein